MRTRVGNQIHSNNGSIRVNPDLWRTVITIGTSYG
jgi:hypothetical protein